LGLGPLERFHGGISVEWALVATFPQLEYPRTWPAEVEVTGPMSFELPYPDIALPAGEEPLVLIAPSTSQDPANRLVRAALAALAGEPVRVVATINRAASGEPPEVPPNAVLVDWLSYSQVMPLASLVICHGGHGTVARALGEGIPVLTSPVAGDMNDRRPHRLGRGRAVGALALLPAGAAALGGAGAARGTPLRDAGRGDRRLGAAA
jgi:UDP:flavonoid glycosyltransferase YjiC (YdhE family)